MTNPLPHDPVSYCWTFIDGVKVGPRCLVEWNWRHEDDIDSTPPEPGDVVEVTLANSQKIIVRALSEERKAERRRAKMAPSIVAHPLYREGQAEMNRAQSRLLALMEAYR